MADQLINREVINISGADINLVREASYKAILHVGDNDLIVDKLISVHEKNDFVNGQTTYIEVDFQYSLGDFIKYVYPSKDKLEMTLINYVVGGETKVTYSLIIKEIEDGIKDDKYVGVHMSELNKSYTHVRAQCISKTFKHMRTQTIEGNYKDGTVFDVISSILLDSFGLISLSFGLGSSGLNFVKPDNVRVYKNIIIKNGTNVIDVPATLQKDKVYGVYNGDINTYFSLNKKETLHIYPLYKDKLFNSFRGCLRIVGISNETSKTIDSTYVVDGDDIKILVGKTNKINDDDLTNRDKGTKIQEMSSDSVISRPYRISKDKIEFASEWLMKRMNHKEMADGSTPVKTNKATGNHYKSRSDILRQDGLSLMFHWKSSNAKLLEPMMPVIYMQELSDRIVEYRGVLHRVDTITDNNSRQENTTLVVFVKPYSGFMDGNDSFNALNDIGESLSLF